MENSPVNVDIQLSSRGRQVVEREIGPEVGMAGAEGVGVLSAIGESPGGLALKRHLMLVGWAITDCTFVPGSP